MANILCVVDIYYESQFFVEKILGVDKFQFSREVNTYAGSKTINAAKALKKLGNSVSVFGKVGDDQESKYAIQDLEKSGLNTEHVLKEQDAKAGRINILTDKSGNSSIVIFKGANLLLMPDEFKILDKQINKFDAVYAATSLSPINLYKLIDICEKNHVYLFLDFPNNHKEIPLEHLHEVNMVSANRQEAELLTGRKINTIKDALECVKEISNKRYGPSLVTLDKDGCVISDPQRKKQIHIPAPKIKQADATGAGDIMRAVFLSEFIKHKDYLKAAKTAIKTATRTVKVKGVINKLKLLKAI